VAWLVGEKRWECGFFTALLTNKKLSKEFYRRNQQVIFRFAEIES